MGKPKILKACDVLVVGSGGAGLVAALAAKVAAPKASVWVLEQSETAGGATAYSGGVCWLPGHRFKQDPSRDTEAARTYLTSAFPEIHEPSLEGFLSDAPRMLDFLLSQAVKMETIPEYPDYYQDLPGASCGRSISPLAYTGPRRVRSMVREVPVFFPPFTVREAMDWGPHRIGHWNKTLLAKRKIAGHLTMGRAFVGFLLEACLRNGVPVSLQSKTEELILSDAQVRGAVVNGREVRCPRVILSCGGFSHRQDLLRLTAAVRPVLSVAPEACDDGGGLALAVKAFLKIGNPYCWWVPIMKLYGENDPKPGPDLWAYHPTLYDRAWPGGIMVNAEGIRFTNESACYNTVGGILALDSTPALDRVWLIWGDFYVRHYIRGVTSYLQPAKAYMNKSSSVDELARKIDVPVSNLRETIRRWNVLVRQGRDDDFHRGESRYDRFMGDRFREGHPNLGPVEPPFQAVRLHPGCLGTKMGPTTDEFGRVCLEDGRMVSGLYAAGNASASFLGNVYPGAGATLGQACVFGYRAARHALDLR